MQWVTPYPTARSASKRKRLPATGFLKQVEILRWDGFVYPVAGTQPIASGKPLPQTVLASVPLTIYHTLLTEEVTNCENSATQSRPSVRPESAVDLTKGVNTGAPVWWRIPAILRVRKLASWSVNTGPFQLAVCWRMVRGGRESLPAFALVSASPALHSHAFPAAGLPRLLPTGPAPPSSGRRLRALSSALPPPVPLRSCRGTGCPSGRPRRRR